MPISKDLLDILVCPDTKVEVEMLDAGRLEKLNRQIEAGGIKYGNGKTVDKPIQEALITQDNQTIYRIEDDIPVMLVDEAIAVRQLSDF